MVLDVVWCWRKALELKRDKPLTLTQLPEVGASYKRITGGQYRCHGGVGGWHLILSAIRVLGSGGWVGPTVQG